MTIQIPQYGLKAYALLFSRYGTKDEFRQSALDWIVSVSMKKKIFSLLLRSGWIKKQPNNAYTCTNPSDAITGLLEFRVPDMMKNAVKDYAFTKLSAIEIWSGFSYVQRGLEKSPYFIKVLRKDLGYWKGFFSRNEIPYYIGSGATIGEYVIVMPVENFSFDEKSGFKVVSLQKTIQFAKSNEAYAYPLADLEKILRGKRKAKGAP